MLCLQKCVGFPGRHWWNITMLVHFFIMPCIFPKKCTFFQEKGRKKLKRPKIEKSASYSFLHFYCAAFVIGLRQIAWKMKALIDLVWNIFRIFFCPGLSKWKKAYFEGIRGVNWIFRDCTSQNMLKMNFGCPPPLSRNLAGLDSFFVKVQ